MAPQADPQTLAGRVRQVLSGIPDPEIPAVSIIDLGIVREIDGEAGTVIVTPTYTGCPATAVIERSIREALDVAGLGDMRIVSRLDPPWTTDWISAEGRRKLHAYGIAPPPPGSAAAGLSPAAPTPCPRCASMATEEISRFGSTPCKALWRCTACGEPFDKFKCH